MPSIHRLAVLAFCLVAASAQAGIILNTLEEVDYDRPGWAGGLEGSYSASGGNSEVLALEAGGRVVWRSDADVWRLQGSAARTESGGAETGKALVGHLRQNHRLGDALHSILFAQIQHNPFQRLQSRWLFGAGGRWDVFANKHGSVSVGATHMVEIERIRNQSGKTTDQRLSAFLRVGRTLRDGVKLDLVGFYQPLWNDFADARAMGIASLRIDLTGAVALRVGGNLDYDARPPTGVEKSDWKTVTGLELRF